MQALVIEYLRPWKLATLAIGLGLLLVGADYYHAPDWDYPISFIMALLSYLTAPWSVQVIRNKRWKMLPLALFWYYFTVDGSYWLYWHQVKPDVLVMREANFFASSCLYWLCGFVWLHNGPLRTLFSRQKDDSENAERLSLRRSVTRLASTMILFWMAYFTYSMATGKDRMNELCGQIRPGMTVSQVVAFAEQHGLGPRRHLNSQTRLAYLAEARAMGRYACRVEFDGGRVRNATYNYAD